MRKVKLELISDPELYIFFEKGMKGGVSYVSIRYSKANNKYLKSYYPKQESKQIYFGVNNMVMQYNNMVMQYLTFFQQMDSTG